MDTILTGIGVILLGGAILIGELYAHKVREQEKAEEMAYYSPAKATGKRKYQLVRAYRRVVA
jgi:hypothetical protein